MTPAEMLRTLDRWREAGLLRALDLALARFVAETDPAAPASLVLGAALAAHIEGQGHTALPLDALAADPAGVVDWPPAALGELQAICADWPADAAGCGDAWGGLAAVELDPADDAGASPLVVANGLLYLRRYWRYERQVAAQIRARTAGDGAASPSAAAVDTAAARSLLDRLFGSRPAGAEPDWQRLACALALRATLTIITGGPGTGKTYTAARLLVLLQALHRGPDPLRVALAAPTGKAAARLRQSIDKALQELRGRADAALAIDAWAARLGPARTLHALLGTQPGTRRFRHDASNPLDVDLLVVDEASMVHLELMARLLDALPATARIVLLGDKDQLASVEAGAVLGELCRGAGEGGDAAGYRAETVAWIRALSGDEPPASLQGAGPALAQQTVVLRRSHRFDGPIGRLAAAVNRGDADAALGLLREDPRGPVAIAGVADAAAILPLARDGRPGAGAGYGEYLERLRARPDGADPAAFDAWAKSVLRSFDAFRLLCAVREGAWGVAGVNAAVERELARVGLLSCRDEWYEGRPVIATRNDPAQRVFNGDIGIVLRCAAGAAALRCFFPDGEGLRSVAVGRLADVETAFAMTVHKSQGSEFGHVALVLPPADAPVLTRELVYTGVTRASEAFTLIAARPALLAAAVGRLTRRSGGLGRMW